MDKNLAEFESSPVESRMRTRSVVRQDIDN